MTTLAINADEAIRLRVVQGRVLPYGPLLMLSARSAFILLAQGMTYLLFLLLEVPNAPVAIRNWWPVC